MTGDIIEPVNLWHKANAAMRASIVVSGIVVSLILPCVEAAPSPGTNVAATANGVPIGNAEID